MPLRRPPTPLLRRRPPMRLRRSPRSTPRRPPGIPMPIPLSWSANPGHTSTRCGPATRRGEPRRGCSSSLRTHTQRSWGKAATNARIPPSRYRGERNRGLNPAPPCHPFGPPTLGAARRTHSQIRRGGNRSSVLDCGAHRLASHPVWVLQNQGGHQRRTRPADISARQPPQMNGEGHSSRHSRPKCGRLKDRHLQMLYDQLRVRCPHDESICATPRPLRLTRRRNRPSPPRRTRRISHSLPHPRFLPRQIAKGRSYLKFRSLLLQNRGIVPRLKTHILPQTSRQVRPRG